jgi:MFS family permease
MNAPLPLDDARRTGRMPHGVWVLGFVSMLMDISSEMIHSLLPLFMVSVLGASALGVGLVEGLAESTAMVVKVFSGTLSDYLGRRKELALTGYALSALTKPLFALAPSLGVVLGARLLDRVGKGIRGAPRDALVADLVAPEMRGAAFGLRQALDTVGAFAGPLLAVMLMLLLNGRFRTIFWVALLPGGLCVALLFFGLSEPAHDAGAGRPRNPLRRASLQRLGASYWGVVGIGALFSLARFSEAFLVLRAMQLGVPAAWVPLCLVAMNLVYAASAYPFGKLADRCRHSDLLALGLVLLMAADLVLARAQHVGMLMAGLVLWGGHLGATQGLLNAMVADTAPGDLRGTAFGVFNLACGLALLPASLLAGGLWDRFGAGATFEFGAGLCALTLLVLLVCSRLVASRPRLF